MATKTIEEITINKIKIGSKSPKAIYKGSTEIKKVTKGSTVVYQKENVTYTLTGSSNNVLADAQEITFLIRSYKTTASGTTTNVGLTSSNVSVTSGTYLSMTVSDYTQGGVTYCKVVLTISKNTDVTYGKTFTLKVTQPISGQSITINGSQLPKVYYLTIDRIGLRFSGRFPDTFLTVNILEFKIQASDGNYLDCQHIFNYGNRYIETGTGIIVYNTTNYQDNGTSMGMMVPNDRHIKGSFSFDGDWAGSTAYQGYTAHLLAEDVYSGSNRLTYSSSSWYWQVGVKPAGPLSFSSYFRNITSNVSANLIIDLNWSWDGVWADDGLI